MKHHTYQSNSQRGTSLTIWFAVLTCLTLFLFMVDLCIGDTHISVTKVWASLTGGECDEITRNIILHIRLTRVVVAGLVGMALSVSGLQMQTVFRNPLADPYLLGVSSGTGLGVALFILGAPLLGLSGYSFLHTAGIVGCGWIGAFCVMLLIMGVSARVKNILAVLIMGVMLGYVVGAVIQIMQYTSTAEQLKLYTLWSMGSLNNVTTLQLAIMAPVVCLSIGLSAISVKPLNILLLGTIYAQTMGLRIKRARTWVFITTTLLAGTVSAFCGPIGFIGLAIPHITKALIKRANHGVLLPACVLTGICGMLLCDIVSKSFQLPVNCVTALTGVPVIVWVTIKNLRKIE